ncbi:hypothetical protein [Roseovarius sp. 2305UL8-3]|uniref:hypothetical protein n=1 Tax=Roseovarius conchicola TaxID=3121636 RepID=UPI00352750F0
MTLTLLHTAEVHRTTFDTLRDRIAPDQALTHLVRSDWLARAQTGIDDALKAEITDTIKAANGPVICTCTTLGPVATAFGATRIDQPMMARAARIGGPIVMAYCVDSTYGPSLDLLEGELKAAGRKEVVHPLPMRALWPLFQADMHEAFHIAIAGEIRQVVAQMGSVGCVVLAQASMVGAAALLADLDVPVLASPELALRAALG